VLVRVYAPQRQRLKALLGSPGPLRIWLNGQHLHARDEVRLVPGKDQEPPSEASDEEVPLELEAGWNTLVFRVGLGTELDRFCLTIKALHEAGLLRTTP
jgi:hypothetical protein